MFRRTAFFSGMILALLFVVFGIDRSFAQDSLTNFEAVDTYISTKMQELGIPGAALVIIHGDQIVQLKVFGVADACIASNPDKKATDWWTT